MWLRVDSVDTEHLFLLQARVKNSRCFWLIMNPFERLIVFFLSLKSLPLKASDMFQLASFISCWLILSIAQ